jgi:hypothetical protein
MVPFISCLPDFQNHINCIQILGVAQYLCQSSKEDIIFFLFLILRLINLGHYTKFCNIGNFPLPKDITFHKKFGTVGLAISVSRAYSNA